MTIKDRLRKTKTSTTSSQKTTKKTRIRSGIDLVDFFEMSKDITGLFIYDNENIYTERNGIIQKENDLFDVSISDLIRVIVTRYENNFVSSGDSYTIENENGTVINILSKPYLHHRSFISFQKKKKYDYSLNALLKDKVLSVEITSFLRNCLLNGQNIFVVGNSTIDKRPLLSYISELVFENLAIIEGKNDIYTSTQNALIFSKQQLPFNELVAKAFSLSHNFIVSECEDVKELMSVFEYINMGYKHFAISFCANSKDELLNNLKNVIMLNYPKMNEISINNLISSSLDIVVYVDKTKDDKIRITDISKLTFDGFKLALEDIYKFDFAKFNHQNLLVKDTPSQTKNENFDELFDDEPDTKDVEQKKSKKKVIKKKTEKKTTKQKSTKKKANAATNPITVKKKQKAPVEPIQQESEKKKNKLQLLKEKVKQMH